MRYIIFGAGAVGGVIGARLHEHGHDVVLIARGAHLDAIQAQGLTIETPDGARTLRIKAVAHPAELTFTPDDAVLLTMKTQHTEAALNDLRAATGPDVAVVCAQNGVENERMALRRFAHVYAMLVILPATFLVPGVVQAHAWPASGVLDAGCYPAGEDDVISRITAALDASGFSARPVANIMRLKYAKLLSNLGNTIQAACPPGSGADDLHRLAVAEAEACYRAAAIDCASEGEMTERRTAISRLGAIDGGVRGGGSSWQSLARGAGSIESDYLNGEIALLGRQHGVPTPVNSALQEIGEILVRDGLQPGSLTPDDIRSRVRT